MTKTALRAIVDLYDRSNKIVEVQMATLKYLVNEGEFLGRISRLRSNCDLNEDASEAAEVRAELHKIQEDYESAQSVMRQGLRDLIAQMESHTDQASATLEAIKAELGEMGEQGKTG